MDRLSLTALSLLMLPRETYLNKRYRILHDIGNGGFGNVYKAIDEVFGCCVAIKETKKESVTTTKLQKAFEREAQLLRSLKHQCLPRVTDYFFNNEAQFLVMDFIEGEDLATTLDRRLTRDGPFSVSEVLPWADSILSALEYLHSQPEPIIHRDIKPANIKLANDGIYLLDFGLAKGSTGQMSTVIEGQPSFSIAGGTRAYAPLEQLQLTGTEPQSDIYSFGATLYHLLTAQVPIDATIRDEAIQRGLGDPLKPAHEVNTTIPVAISRVIEQAMIIRWWDRTASAKDMRAALAQASGDLVSTIPKLTEKASASGPPASNQGTVERSKLRKGWLVTGVSVLILAVATLGALLILPQWFGRSTPIGTNNSIETSPTLKPPIEFFAEPIATHNGVWSVAISPDGSLAASASANNTVFLWDTQFWAKPRQLTGHVAVFSPDGKLLAAGGADKKLRLWDLPSLTPIEREPPFSITKPVYRLAFSADSSTLAMFTAERGNGDTDIQLWDLRSNNQATLKGEKGVALLSIAFSPNSNVLFSTGQDNKLRAWNLTEKTSEVLQTYSQSLKALVFSPDGQYLACASEDKTIKLWSYNSQTRKWLEQRTLNVSNGEISSLAFSSDGTTLVITVTNNTIYLWDVASSTSQPSVIVNAEAMLSPAFSSNPQMFLTVGANRIWLWRPTTAQETL